MDKTGRPVIGFDLTNEKDNNITGSVRFDYVERFKPEVSDKLIFELWWNEECYILFYNNINMMNQLTLLLKRSDKSLYGFSTYKEYKEFMRSKKVNKL